MKANILKIAVFILIPFFNHNAFADASGSAAGAAMTIGALFSIVNITEAGLSPADLQAFTDPETKSSSQINSVDGLLIESKIVDIVPGVFILVAVKNESNHLVTIDSQKMKLIFENGLERFPDQDSVGTIMLNPNEKSAFVVRSPKKSDFNSQGFFNILIPIENNQKLTTAQIRYTKNPFIVEKELSDATIFDLGIELGTAYFSGNTKNQASSNRPFSFGTNLGFYWSSHHGIHLGLKTFDYNVSSETTNAINPKGTNFVSPFTISTLGYTYRKSYSDVMSLNLSLLYAGVSLNYSDSAATYTKAQTSTLGARIEFNYLLQKITRGPLLGTYTLYYGADYFHLSQFENTVGNLSGGVSSAFVGFKIGL